MTCPPDVALNERLAALVSPALRRLLFVSLTDTAATTAALEPLVAGELSTSSLLTEPSEWAPFPRFDARVAALADYSVYVALVLRVNVLERFAKVLRAVTAPDARTHALAHYMHAWLDAHLLACLALQQAAAPPTNSSPFLTALLDAYAPDALRTVFHEGALPALVDAVEACSFFSEPTTTTESLDMTALFNKMIPRRCGVRNVIANIEHMARADEGVTCFLEATMAASLLGIYRHTTVWLPLAERLRVYRVFFFVPPPDLAAALAAQHAMRGTRVNAAAEYSHHVAFRGADDASTYASPPALTNDVQRRHDAMLSFVTSHVTTPASTPATAPQQRYVYQNTIVNVLREYLVFVLTRFLPHINEQLCATTSWHDWQARVIRCMDAMRRLPASPTCVLRAVPPAALPPRTLYQVQTLTFAEAVAAAATAFLDAGEPTALDVNADGSESALDAVVTPDVEYVLTHLVRRYVNRVHTSMLEPVMSVPRDEDEFVHEYVPRGRVPLSLFYASDAAVREYCAAQRLYARMPSQACATAFVRFLVINCGMYQFMLMHAFVRAQVDCMRVYAFPLPRHVAHAQARALRARYGIAETEPLPIHLMSSFVCMHCREFRGALVGADALATSAVPMSGSDDVCFQTTCIESGIARRLRERGFPTYASLEGDARDAGGTLFAWYRTYATIDASTDMYPADPTAYNALPTSLETAHAWLARVDATAPVGFDLPPPSEPSLAIERTLERVPPPPAPSLGDSPFASGDSRVYEDFLVRWQRANGRPFICGHRSADPRDTSVIWTCGSKRYKTEERKTRQTLTATQKIDDAITDKERVAARRSVNHRRRHDMRCYYHYTKCSRSRLVAVSMLGYGVRIDGLTIVACCACLGYMNVEHARWRGDVLLCARCHAAPRTGDGARSSVAAPLCCRQCGATQKSSKPFASVYAYDDQYTRTFVSVALCDRHVAHKQWLFTSPTYHTLTTIDVGLRDRWGSLQSWDPTREYLMCGTAATTLVDSDDETSVLSLTRELVGDDVLGDDDGDDDADADAATTSVAPTAPKRRRVQGDASRRRKRL